MLVRVCACVCECMHASVCVCACESVCERESVRETTETGRDYVCVCVRVSMRIYGLVRALIGVSCATVCGKGTHVVKCHACIVFAHMRSSIACVCVRACL